MPKVLCSVPQDSAAARDIPRLEAALRRSYAAQLGGAAPLVVWCAIPRGQAYTEGRLAEGAWIMVEVADGLEAAVRERAMLAIGREFARTAGMPVEKLMVTLCDRSLFAAYLAANRRRMRPLARLAFGVRTIARVLASRRRLGYAAIGPDY